ncbi:hypothetical protein [Amycolatopsis sp. cmx-8-4]|uniref:hypothetical protein n=1 Tax=Amycolatopsis sp. cmx-8-4 TaxID=2790947 RepID=UPI00397E0B0D
MTSDRRQRGTVVICGSMKSLDLMSRIASVIEKAGVQVVTPSPDEFHGDVSVEAKNNRKREASRKHMNLIKSDDTAAVLVVNTHRPNAENYIGPNSFAEIGVAFADDRKVFLLHGMPDAYLEELSAWGVYCLNGDVQPLLSEISAPREIDFDTWRMVLQPELV